MAKTVFGIKNSKQIFFSISSVFAFKQAKEHILFQVILKNFLNENISFAHFRVTAEIFCGLATKERGNIKTWHFGIGVLPSYNNLAQLRMCRFLFFKITPPFCKVLQYSRLPSCPACCAIYSTYPEEDRQPVLHHSRWPSCPANCAIYLPRGRQATCTPSFKVTILSSLIRAMSFSTFLLPVKIIYLRPKYGRIEETRQVKI